MESEPQYSSSWFGGRWVPKPTHGVALLLGVIAWQVLPHDQAPDDAQLTKSVRRSHTRDSSAQASAWVDATLASLRKKDRAAEKEHLRPATMEEFLKETRQESEKWWLEANVELDQILAKSKAMGRLSDPAAALRAALREDGGNVEKLAIFQDWLDADPDAALAEMRRNWRMFELGYLPELLERKFGIDWIVETAADENAPFRLRTALARELGHKSARGEGLAALLGFYSSIPDPKLKIRMAWEFSNEWPLGETGMVAQFLSGDVPRELRDVLMEQWTRLPYGEAPWEAVWLKDLHAQLGMEPYEYTESYHSCLGGGDMGDSLRKWRAREKMTFDELLQDYMKEGESEQKAVEQAIWPRVQDALNSRNLIEMFGEGQLTRVELLDQVRRQIPESDAHSDALERAVWAKTAWAADPKEVARWAAELSERGDMDELLEQTFTPSSIDGDPRMPLRFDRYRVVTQRMEDGRSRSQILGSAVWEWTRWQAVSPIAAEAWWNQLPENEPLHAAIRSREAQRKENQR
jgi:hypothetical protein